LFGKPFGKGPLEKLDVGGKIILKWVLVCEFSLIQLAQNRVQLLVLVNMSINLRVPEKAVNFATD
jgi:hypothetical protein